MEKININLLFFGPLKSYFGDKSNMPVPKGTQLSQILKKLLENKPDAKDILNSCQIAVNSEFKSTDYSIVQSSEVAILPPFSGG